MYYFRTADPTPSSEDSVDTNQFNHQSVLNKIQSKLSNGVHHGMEEGLTMMKRINEVFASFENKVNENFHKLTKRLRGEPE